MRLVSLRLRNIRSYTDATVEFGDGINLFEGDVGSGKSTILLAVEFALFGLAEVASASLLRHGEREGCVELVFQVKGRTVRATRKLGRTGSGASVKGCVLEVDGKGTKHSSNEMRQRVLELLEYGERRNPRARLDIFTYSVYTPQEDMRTVLTNDTRMRNQRKDTLRRALDLEEYDLAATNLDKVRLQLDNDAAELRGMASDIDAVGKELERAEAELTEERGRLGRAREDQEVATRRLRDAEDAHGRLKEEERAFREAQHAAKDAESALAKAQAEVGGLSDRLTSARDREGELDDVRSRISQLSAELEELASLEGKEEALDRMGRELKDEVGDLERKRVLLEAARESAERVRKMEGELEGLPDPEEGIKALRQELEDLRSEGARLEQQVRGLEEEVIAIDGEDQELTSLEGEAACPRCRQPLTREHLKGILEENERRRRDISSRMREAASRRNRVSEKIVERERALEELEGARDARKHLLHDLAMAREGAKDLTDLERAVEGHRALSLERELKELEATRDADRLTHLRRSAGAMQELEKRRVVLEGAVEGIPDLEAKLKEAQGTLDRAMRTSEEAQERVEKAEASWDEGALAKAMQELQEAQRAEASLSSSIEGIGKMVHKLEGDAGRLRDNVERMEGILERQALHVHVSQWLSDRVIPAIRSMERSMMALMAEEMDGAAGHWFGQLVEDPDLVLYVDEEFVPTVTHQEYEMDLGALSGGERTAAAFAYRLALNGLVRRNATPDQRNLLILDEPTDGFSREQLARMGNVFTELAADQVVVVSHDRELRTFADRVYLVEKSGGSSSVRQVA